MEGTQKENAKTRPSRHESAEQSVCYALLSPCGWGNLGDVAIQESMIQGIRRRQPHASIIGITLNPEDTVRRHRIPAFGLRRGRNNQIRLVPGANCDDEEMAIEVNSLTPAKVEKRQKPSVVRIAGKMKRFVFSILAELAHVHAAYRLLGSVDSLIISGGGQLDDYWGGAWAQPYSLFKWTALARLRHVPVSFLSVGAGPIEYRLSSWFIKKSLNRAMYSSYRDEYSRKLVQNLGLKKLGTVAPDLAHGLEHGFGYDERATNNESPIIGIGPIPYFSPTAWPQKDAETYRTYIEEMAVVARLLAEQGMIVRFFSAEINMDRDAIADIHKMVSTELKGSSASRIEYPVIRSLAELLEVLNGVDAVITSRFHGVLLALVLRKPTIGLSYHRKIDDLLRDVGQEEYIINLKDFSSRRVLDLLNSLLADRRSVSATIASREAEYRELLEQQFDAVLGMQAQAE